MDEKCTEKRNSQVAKIPMLKKVWLKVKVDTIATEKIILRFAGSEY